MAKQVSALVPEERMEAHIQAHAYSPGPRWRGIYRVWKWPPMFRRGDDER